MTKDEDRRRQEASDSAFKWIRKVPAEVAVRIPLHPRGEAIFDVSTDGRWHLSIEGAGEPWVSRCEITGTLRGGPLQVIIDAIREPNRPGESHLIGHSCWLRREGEWVMLAVSNAIRGWCHIDTLAIALGCLKRAGGKYRANYM